MWSAIFQAKSDLVGTSSAIRKLVGSSVSAAVPSALVASSTSEQEVHSRYSNYSMCFRSKYIAEHNLSIMWKHDNCISVGTIATDCNTS